MLPPEPRPSRWELHWQMFGGEIRIRPLFWTSCVLLGFPYYQYPKIGGLGAFGLWITVILVSLLIHETSHLFAARLFGARLRIVLSGLGGQVYGLEELRRWQRVLVLLAGPLGNLLVFAILWGITALPLPMDWRRSLAPAIWLLMWVNAFWSLLNVVPLWPLDGGRLAHEAGEGLLGRRGQTLALLLSLLVCLLMTGTVLWWARLNLTNPFDERYLIYLIFFCIMTLYCYAFWLSAFRALWGDFEPLDESAPSDRAA